MASILKPHIFFTFLRHHHKPSLSTHPRFSTTTPQSLDSKFAETISRIKNLIKNKESTSLFDTKAPRLYRIFTSEPESLHSMFIDASKCEKQVEHEEEEEEENEEGVVVLSRKDNNNGDSYLGFKRMEEVTQDLKFLVGFLCNEGYLKRIRMFMPLEELGLKHFQSVYSRGWVRRAAQRFGDANPDMVKCLSMNEVKTLARFGCSSDADRTVVVAKVVRSYLGIDEVSVCFSCKLRETCKTKDIELKERAKDLELGDVMQMLTSYALGLVDHKLTVPNEVKESTHKLLNQVVEGIRLRSSSGSLADQSSSLAMSRKHARRRRKVRMILRAERNPAEKKQRYMKKKQRQSLWKKANWMDPI